MHCERVLFTDVENQQELFDVVSSHLEKLGYVTPEYREKIVEREKDFPTGFKLDFLEGKEGLNVAIPHAETQYCLTKTVFYVKNSKYITFHNIINPEEELEMCLFFFILNNESGEQSNILAGLMEFFTTGDNLSVLKDMTDKIEIEEFLLSKGVFSND